MYFCGIDWSEKKLDYHLQNAARKELAKGSVQASVAGLADLYEVLERHGSAEEIGVAIETCHGAWIQAMLDRGYKIYPVNPKAAERFREALGANGVKTDTIDSKVLSMFLLTFHKEMKVLRPDDPEIVKLRILCQDRLRLCEEHTAKINELQAVVKGYYPAFVGLFGRMDSEIALDFLIRYPTQGQFRKLSDRRFVNWVGRHHYTCRRRIEGMLEKLHAPAFEIAEHLQDSKKHLIVYLSRSLKMLNAEIAERDREINGHLDGFAECDWIRSLPGAGNVLAPSLLACLGRDPERFGWPAGNTALYISDEAAGSSPVAHFSCLPSSLAIGARGHRLFIRNNETADTSIMRLFVLWLIDGSR